LGGAQSDHILGLKADRPSSLIEIDGAVCYSNDTRRAVL
jgi:hypothetical protein